MSEEPSQLHLTVLERMLAAAARQADPSETPPEAVDFDWHAPCHFTRSQLERVEEFAGTVAQKVSEALTTALRSPTTVESEPVTQHFGSHLGDTEGEETHYSVRVSDGARRTCGVLVITPACAAGWVGTLLGSPEGGGEDRELSVLENTLLSEVITALSGAFSEASKAAGGAAFQLESQVSRGRLNLPGDQSSEFCRIAFRPEHPDDEAPVGVSLLVLSEVLDSVAGVESGDSEQKGGIDSRAEIAAHLERSVVKVEVWVGTAAASIQEVAALEPGDVLLLQKRVNEPVELAVENRHILSGMPVISDGHYAVQVIVPAGATARARKVPPGQSTTQN